MSRDNHLLSQAGHFPFFCGKCNGARYFSLMCTGWPESNCTIVPQTHHQSRTSTPQAKLKICYVPCSSPWQHAADVTGYRVGFVWDKRSERLKRPPIKQSIFRNMSLSFIESTGVWAHFEGQTPVSWQSHLILLFLYRYYQTPETARNTPYTSCICMLHSESHFSVLFARKSSWNRLFKNYRVAAEEVRLKL